MNDIKCSQDTILMSFVRLIDSLSFRLVSSCLHKNLYGGIHKRLIVLGAKHERP